MEKLLGKSETGGEIAEFLKSLSVNSKIELPKASKHLYGALRDRPACEYHNYHQLGLSLCFEESHLQALHVYNGTHGYSPSPAQLPHNLSLKMTGKQVVELLGEPDEKMGGGRGGAAISIAYKDKGLHINFVGRLWEDNENLIDSVTIHTPEQDRALLQLPG